MWGVLIAMLWPSLLHVLSNGATHEEAWQLQSVVPDDPFGIEFLNDILDNAANELCSYVRCAIPSEVCPEGAVFVEGVAQMGCCGACVRFRQREDACTGSIDLRVKARVPGTLKARVPGTLKAGVPGTLKARVPGTLKARVPGTLKAKLPGTLKARVPDTLKAGVPGTLKARVPGTREVVTPLSFLPPVDNIIDSSWCGNDLFCNMTSGGCEPYIFLEGCKFIQQQYDIFTTSDTYVKSPYRYDYLWRPNCTQDGFFAEKQCRGPPTARRCLCVDQYGDTIYGSAYELNTDMFDTMNCKCSREVWRRQHAGVLNVTLHCQENGNYEDLQCENGTCYCMDPVNGTTVTSISAVLEEFMDRLPCYSKRPIGQQYLRRCESELFGYNALREVMKARGYKTFESSLKCDYDGSYNSIRIIDGRSFCVDKYGEIISVTNDVALDCNCERDKLLLQETNLKIKLTCDGARAPGEYATCQFQENIIYCSDNSGIRIGPYVYKSFTQGTDCDQTEFKMKCAEAIACQDGNHTSCTQVCTECDKDDEKAYPLYQPPSTQFQGA